MRHRFAPRRPTSFDTGDIIKRLKEGKKIVYCATTQQSFERAKKQIVDTLQLLGEDTSIVDNLICKLPGNSPGMNAKIYLDEYKL